MLAVFILAQGVHLLSTRVCGDSLRELRGIDVHAGNAGGRRKEAWAPARPTSKGAAESWGEAATRGEPGSLRNSFWHHGWVLFQVCKFSTFPTFFMGLDSQLRVFSEGQPEIKN